MTAHYTFLDVIDYEMYYSFECGVHTKEFIYQFIYLPKTTIVITTVYS
jgi:hypothetical protein